MDPSTSTSSDPRPADPRIRCQICAAAKVPPSADAAASEHLVPDSALVRHIAAHLHYSPHRCMQCAFACHDPADMLKHVDRSGHTCVEFNATQNAFLDELCNIAAEMCRNRHIYGQIQGEIKQSPKGQVSAPCSPCPDLTPAMPILSGNNDEESGFDFFGAGNQLNDQPGTSSQTEQIVVSMFMAKSNDTSNEATAQDAGKCQKMFGKEGLLQQQDGSADRKRYHRSFDATKKLEAIEWAKNHGKNSASRKYRVHRSVIRDWIRNEDKLQEQVNSPSGEKRKRLAGGGRPILYPEIDAALADWIRQMREQGKTVSRSIIRTRAQAMFAHTPMKVSEGWLHGFLKRHNFLLRPTGQQGQANSTNFGGIGLAAIFGNKNGLAQPGDDDELMIF